MASPPSADRSARLLQEYMRAPARYRAEMSQRTDRAPDSEIVFKLALGRRVEFTSAALNGADGDKLRDAAAAFVRNVYLRPEATPYQTLGIESDASAEVIKERFRLLMQLVHPDRHDAQAQWPESCAAQVNRAYAILRNETARAKYDGEQRAARIQQARAVATPSYPSARWPNGAAGGRKPPPAPVLPEWLTDGVGGYARRHPAVVAFIVLIVGATLVVVASFRDDQVQLLTQEAHPSRPAVMASAAVAPETTPPPAVAATAPVPSAAPVNTPVSAAPVNTPVSAASVSTPVSAAPVSTPVSAAVVSAPVSVASVTAPVATVTAATPTLAAPATTPSATAKAPLDSVAAAGKVEGTGLGTAAPADRGRDGASIAIAASAPSAGPANPIPTAAPPPTTAELEAFFSAFVEAYDQGRLEAFVALFDEAAESNLHRGRAAIRGEYDELFRLSDWRRMQLTRINWRRDGDRTIAKGEVAVKIRWQGGNQVEQRVLVDMEVARRDGRLQITRLMHQPRSP